MNNYKSEERKIAINYLFNMTYKLFNICMPLITAPYLSRVVGAEGLGLYAYYYAIAHYFYLVGKMGLNNYGTRCIAAVKDDIEKRSAVFSSIYTQQLFTAGSMALVYFMFCFIKLRGSMILPAVLGLYVIGCLLDIDWLWCGLEKFNKMAVKNILVKLITLVGIFTFVKSTDDLWKYTLIMSLGMFVGFLTLWFGIGEKISWKKTELSDAMRHLKKNFVLMIPVLASNIYRSMDKIMVGQISSMTELGYYDSAEKIIYAVSGLITAFTNVMMPRCSHLYAVGKLEQCKKYIGYSMNFLFFSIGGIAFGCVGIASRVIILVFGNDFTSSIVLLQILAVTLFPMIWSEVIRSMWIIPQNQDKIFLIAISTGAILNLITNLMFIPYLGAKGAAIATIVAELSVLLVQSCFLHQQLSYPDLLINIVPYLLSGGMMAFFLSIISHRLSNSVVITFLLIAIGGAIYLIFCIVTIWLMNRELFHMILKKIKRFPL